MPLSSLVVSVRVLFSMASMVAVAVIDSPWIVLVCAMAPLLVSSRTEPARTIVLSVFIGFSFTRRSDTRSDARHGTGATSTQTVQEPDRPVLDQLGRNLPKNAVSRAGSFQPSE